MGFEDNISDRQADEIQPDDDDGHLADQIDVSRNSFAEARAAMIFICALLAIFALVSLGCFLYQFFYRLENGEGFVGAPVRWPAIFGHLIRGVGLTLVCWRLAQYVRSIKPHRNEVDAILSERHRTFWETFALAFLVITAFSTFQVAYISWQDRIERDAFFRPEFESGRASFRRDRIEIRRGYTEPNLGLQRMQKPDSVEHLFVAGEREITGRDIDEATIQINEIFPGTQSVHLQVKFTPDGARKMEKLTKEHESQPLAVLIDGELRGTPRVFSVISNNAMLGGVLTLEEAAKIIIKGGDK